MPDALRAVLIFPGLFVVLVIVIFTPRLPRWAFANLLALTMKPGVRYTGWRWDQIRRYVYDRDGHECQASNCHATYRQLNCHHKQAVKDGGSHFTNNLETLCHRCHARRHPENGSM